MIDPDFELSTTRVADLGIGEAWRVAIEIPEIISIINRMTPSKPDDMSLDDFIGDQELARIITNSTLSDAQQLCRAWLSGRVCR